MNKRVVLLFFPNPSPGDLSHCRIPYALLYLERALRDLDVEVLLLDEQQIPDYQDVVSRLSNRLLLAGVSCLTGQQILSGIRFSEMVKQISGAVTVWGGWHATLLPEQTLQEPYIDFVIMGQGERPLNRLVQKLLVGGDISDIDGLAFKRDGAVKVNPASGPESLQDFPPVNFGLLDLEKYLIRNRLPERYLCYFTSHGCPFDCAFCCISKVYKNHWFHKPVDLIIRELTFLKERVGLQALCFDDDNFFVRPDFARELAKAMIAAKLDLKWETSAHARMFRRHFSDADIDLFAQSGCRQVYIGAESGDQEVLDLLDKRTTVDDNCFFIERLKRHGIVPQISTMVCLPTDSRRDIDLTLDMIRRAKLQESSLRASIFFYTPYPGTRLYDLARSKGFTPPQTLRDWSSHTLRRFQSPWAPKAAKWRLEIFMNFYFAMMDSKFYRRVPSGVLRILVFLLNKSFFPIAWLRFKANWFRYPLEAILFLRLLRCFNKVTGKTYCLGSETYIS